MTKTSFEEKVKEMKKSMVGRENRMTEVKKENQRLQQRLGEVAGEEGGT